MAFGALFHKQMDKVSSTSRYCLLLKYSLLNLVTLADDIMYRSKKKQSTDLRKKKDALTASSNKDYTKMKSDWSL